MLTSVLYLSIDKTILKQRLKRTKNKNSSWKSLINFYFIQHDGWFQCRKYVLKKLCYHLRISGLGHQMKTEFYRRIMIQSTGKKFFKLYINQLNCSSQSHDCKICSIYYTKQLMMRQSSLIWRSLLESN